MISIRQLLKSYLELLVVYWENMELLSSNDPTESLKDDWLQANWELIVEGLLGDGSLVLEPYGDGADCNGASSRVLYPDRLPNYRLICKSLSGELVYDYLNDQKLDTSKDIIIFDRFVSIDEDGWYYEILPFDKVLGQYEGENVVVDFDIVDFQLQPIKREDQVTGSPISQP